MNDSRRLWRGTLLTLAESLSTQALNLSLFLPTWAKLGVQLGMRTQEAIQDLQNEMHRFLDDLTNEDLTDEQVFALFKAANQRYQEATMMFQEEVEGLARG